jgi:hypothetical protein
MWGNATGWTISAILLLLMGIGVHALAKLGQISDPTAFALDPANNGPVALETDPNQIVNLDGEGDASGLYRQAIGAYLAHQDQYDRAASAKNETEITSLPAIAKLLDATHAHRAMIFNDGPEKIVTYQDKPQLDACSAMGHLLSRAGLLTAAHDPAAAVKLFEAEFSLGNRLYQERLTATEFLTGIELLADACGGLSRALDKAKQNDRANSVRAFDGQRLAFFNQRILPMLRVLQSIDPNIVSEHAGDIFYFAEHSEERMWRVEAIFALGRMQYFVGENGRAGNQRGATRELKKLTNDPDPIIQQAAKEALGLTIDQYRTLH